MKPVKELADYFCDCAMSGDELDRMDGHMQWCNVFDARMVIKEIQEEARNEVESRKELKAKLELSEDKLERIVNLIDKAVTYKWDHDENCKYKYAEMNECPTKECNPLYHIRRIIK